MLPGLAPGTAPICVSAGQEPVRTDERRIRRSVDRRGRPTRRDPDVRRGATATLTASSTDRQRVGEPPGRVGPPVCGVPSPPAGPGGGPWAVGILPATGGGSSSVMLGGVCG